MHHLLTHPSGHAVIVWQPSARSSCNRVIALVARQKNISVCSVKCNRRGTPAVARARQVAMYLAHVVFGHSLTEVGEIFGRDRTTVSYACALIEDLRDDRGFDAEICALEDRLLDSYAKVVRHVA
jgi:chromosomal replication initiation ATPase DnaA